MHDHAHLHPHPITTVPPVCRAHDPDEGFDTPGSLEHWTSSSNHAKWCTLKQARLQAGVLPPPPVTTSHYPSDRPYTSSLSNTAD
ncbi:hypothetical protein J6590_021500 [Homalodisca vitripennis]|nr:hypothetical protein J6590_021500 [Homalodisca vitripennis]